LLWITRQAPIAHRCHFLSAVYRRSGGRRAHSCGNALLVIQLPPPCPDSHCSREILRPKKNTCREPVGACRPGRPRSRSGRNPPVSSASPLPLSRTHERCDFFLVAINTQLRLPCECRKTLVRASCTIRKIASPTQHVGGKIPRAGSRKVWMRCVWVAPSTPIATPTPSPPHRARVLKRYRSSNLLMARSTFYFLRRPAIFNGSDGCSTSTRSTIFMQRSSCPRPSCSSRSNPAVVLHLQGSSAARHLCNCRLGSSVCFAFSVVAPRRR